MALVSPSAGFILLCSLVPNRPRWVPVCGPESGGPWSIPWGGVGHMETTAPLPSLISRALRLKLTHGAPIRAPWSTHCGTLPKTAQLRPPPWV